VWPFSDPRIGERDYRRIVIRVPHPLGDAVMATPALHAMRDRYPDAHIALHGRDVARQLYSGLTCFDEFLCFEKHEPFRDQVRTLRERDFELCVLLTGSFRTALPPFRARIPHRLGYRRSARTFMLTAHRRRPRPGGKKAPYPTKLYYLDLIAMLGAKSGGRVRLAVTREDEAAAAEWLRRQGVDDAESLVCLCVGAAFGPSKIWPAEYFAAVADHMVAAHGARPIVLCAPDERQAGARVRAHAAQPLVDSGTDPIPLGALKAILARTRVLVTNDTGPRHIAAALGVPSVCVLGPMPSEYTEADTEGQINLREPVPCAPCHKKVCRVEGHPCMTKVTPDRVIAALERVWEPR
jgi:heptosyltransferase-2